MASATTDARPAYRSIRLRGALPGLNPGTRVRCARWLYAVAKWRSTSGGGTSISRATREPGSGRVETVTKSAPVDGGGRGETRTRTSHRHRLLRPARLPFRHSPVSRQPEDKTLPLAAHNRGASGQFFEDK